MIAQLELELPKLTPQEYLAWEANQPLKYEYLAGQVLAMTGGIVDHGLIALNLASALKTHLKGTGCRVFMSDVKVGLQWDGPYFYPDVMVSCDSRDRQANQIIQFPCLITEVLSPATEAYDRGTKFAHYRRLPSLQEYVLISAEQQVVECFRRNAEGHWVLYVFNGEDELQLISTKFHGPMALLYEDTTLVTLTP